MNLTVNEESRVHRGDGTLRSLLEELGAAGQPVAVMVNGRVVPRAERDGCRLKDGDRVEVLTFVGGG
jgi:sulfur carrier protein